MAAGMWRLLAGSLRGLCWLFTDCSAFWMHFSKIGEEGGAEFA